MVYGSIDFLRHPIVVEWLQRGEIGSVIIGREAWASDRRFENIVRHGFQAASVTEGNINHYGFEFTVRKD